ncbi:hypothetical protein AB6809_35990 [Paraburkholderia sp. RCC_158]
MMDVPLKPAVLRSDDSDFLVAGIQLPYAGRLREVARTFELRLRPEIVKFSSQDNVDRTEAILDDCGTE